MAYDLSRMFYSCRKMLEFWIDDFMNMSVLYVVVVVVVFFKILKICWGFLAFF